MTIDLEDGIIAHLRAKRMQYLENHAIESCYTKKDFNFQQAERCEKFLYENDYKLNLLKSFTTDHLVRHLKEYNQCYNNEAFNSLKTNEAKDRVFLECHNNWVRNLNINLSQDLEIKARQLF